MKLDLDSLEANAHEALNSASFEPHVKLSPLTLLALIARLRKLEARIEKLDAVIEEAKSFRANYVLGVRTRSINPNRVMGTPLIELTKKLKALDESEEGE